MEGPTGSVNTSKASGAAGTRRQRGPRPRHHAAPRRDARAARADGRARADRQHRRRRRLRPGRRTRRCPPDEQWTSHFGWGRAEHRRGGRRGRRGEHPAGGGDRLARLVRAADRLERRDHGPRARALRDRRPAPLEARCGAPARRRRRGRRVREGDSSGTVTDFGSIDLEAVRSALATYVVPAGRRRADVRGRRAQPVPEASSRCSSRSTGRGSR